MNTIRYTLARRELLALEHPEGFVVECVEGELWITADGVAGDIVLHAGERMCLAGSPKAVVSALRPAIVVAQACRSGAPIRSLVGAGVALLAERIRRWRHAPLASYPVIRLR